MKKFLFTLLVLGMTATALTGCKVSGEVDPDGATQVAPARCARGLASS
jgi:hypothetical protein